jgi:ribonuclease P protein component
MIARKYRFHGYNALNFVYKQGRTARSPMLLLRYAPNPRRTECRVAVVISKKVNKSAVDRNRMRRRIYGVVEDRVGEWPAYDMVFTVTDDKLRDISEKDIKNIINDILQISGLHTQPVDK